MNHNHAVHLPAKFFSSATTVCSSQTAASSGCPPAKTLEASVSWRDGTPSLPPSLPLSPVRTQARAARVREPVVTD